MLTCGEPDVSRQWSSGSTLRRFDWWADRSIGGQAWARDSRSACAWTDADGSTDRRSGGAMERWIGRLIDGRI